MLQRFVVFHLAFYVNVIFALQFFFIAAQKYEAKKEFIKKMKEKKITERDSMKDENSDLSPLLYINVVNLLLFSDRVVRPHKSTDGIVISF